MNKNSGQHDLSPLLAALCDESITPEQLAQLEERLRTDPEARRFYLEYLDLHASLIRSHHRVTSSIKMHDSEIELLVDTENIRLVLEEEAIISQREAAEQARIESLAAEKFLAFRREQDRQRRPEPAPIPRNAFYATVSSLAAAAILFIFWMLPDPVPVAPTLVAPTPMVVASIDDSIDAQWSDPSLSTEPGTQLSTLNELVLTRGVVQIAFEGGAKAVVEAPATLELLSADSARLAWGKLVGRVPRDEVRLTIKTPNASITDLGTEFGVEVNRQQVTHLHVFEGSVLAATLDAEGKTAQQRTVLVDEAVSLQPDTGVIEPATTEAASRFVRHMHAPVPFVRFYTTREEWLAAVHDVEQFALTADTLPMAEEVKSPPDVNQNLGPRLTFLSAKTSLTRSFQVLMREPGGGPRHGFVFGDTGDPETLVEFEGVVSVGAIDQFEDDDFEVRLLGDGPPVTAMAVVLRQNNDTEDLEKYSVYDATGSLVGQLKKIPPMDEQEETFLGLVSNVPLGHIIFDEDEAWDDIALSEVIFATGSESEPSTNE